MTYTYSFDTKQGSRLDPAYFVQEQNDIWESENSDEFSFDFLDTPTFDPDEIL